MKVFFFLLGGGGGGGGQICLFNKACKPLQYYTPNVMDSSCMPYKHVSV